MNNPLGMSIAGAASTDDNIKKLFEKITPIIGSLGHLHTSLHHLQKNLGTMAELSARANAALMLLVGLPRIFRSDLYHMVAYGSHTGFGLGGKIPLPGGGTGRTPFRPAAGFSPSGGGTSFGSSPVAGFNADVRKQILDANKASSKLEMLLAQFGEGLEGAVQKAISKIKEGKSEDSPLAGEGLADSPRLESANEIARKRVAWEDEVKKIQGELDSGVFGDAVSNDSVVKKLRDEIAEIEDDINFLNEEFDAIDPKDPERKTKQNKIIKETEDKLNEKYELENKLSTRENKVKEIRKEELTQRIETLQPRIEKAKVDQIKKQAEEFESVYKYQSLRGGYGKVNNQVPLLDVNDMRAGVPESLEFLKSRTRWHKRKSPFAFMGNQGASGFIGGALDGFSKQLRAGSLWLQRHNLRLIQAAGPNSGIAKFFTGFNQVLRGKANPLDTLTGATGKMAMPVLYSGAILGSLLSTASPDAFATLTGSVKLLSIALGTHLIPYALGASLWLQKLAFRVREGDSELFKWIAFLSSWGLAIGGTVVALGILASIIKGVVAPAFTFCAFMVKSFGIQTSLVAGAFALALTALVISMYQATEKGNKLNKEKLKTEEDLLKEAESGGASEEIKEKIGKALRSANPQYELGKVLKEASKKSSDAQIDALNVEASANRSKGEMSFLEVFGNVPFLGQGATGLYSGMLGMIPNKDFGQKHLMEGMGQGKTPLQILGEFAERGNAATRDRLFVKKIMEDHAAGKDVSKFKDPKGERNTLMNQLLMNMQTIKGTAQFSSIEEAHKRTMVAAAGDDPLEQTIKKWQNENFQEMMKQSQLLLEQNSHLKDIKNSTIK